jgi:hypothetical protein
MRDGTHARRLHAVCTSPRLRNALRFQSDCHPSVIDRIYG